LERGSNCNQGRPPGQGGGVYALSLLDGVKGRVSVRSAHEFVADYDKLFSVGLRQYILGHDSSCVHRVGDKGYTIGSGVLWFDIYDKGEFRIFTINGTEPWDD
jgi:hypothetical protein